MAEMHVAHIISGLRLENSHLKPEELIHEVKRTLRRQLGEAVANSEHIMESEHPISKSLAREYQMSVFVFNARELEYYVEKRLRDRIKVLLDLMDSTRS